MWTNARMLGTRERGIARRRMKLGGAYQRNPLSSAIIFPPGSTVVKVLYLPQQGRVFPLLLREFLRFAEQAFDSLQYGWIWTPMFALTKGRVCRRGGNLGGEHWVRCILVLLFSRSSP